LGPKTDLLQTVCMELLRWTLYAESRTDVLFVCSC